MTLALTRDPAVRHADPLAPVRAALDHVRGPAATFGIADHLVVDASAAPADPLVAPYDAAAASSGPLAAPADRTAGHRWRPAGTLLTDDGVQRLLAAPRLLWQAQPHAAAALAFKQYTYWLAMPAVLGWATARRVPLLGADNVAVDVRDSAPYLTLGMLRPTVAVLPDDPAAGAPGTRVVAGPARLLAILRTSLLDGHVAPLIGAVRARVRVGAHTLHGQLAAAVCYALAAADPAALRDEPIAAAETLLAALGLTGEAGLARRDGALEVRRNTCCLAFVTPGLAGNFCANCCVPRRP